MQKIIKLTVALTAAGFFLSPLPFSAQTPLDQPKGSVVEYHTFASEALGKEVPYGIYLPEGYYDDQTMYPVLIFLHGLYNNEREWERRGINTIVDELIANKSIQKMIIAIPQGKNSFYTNAVTGTPPYEDAIVNDFIPFLDQKYRTKNSPRFRAVSGVSMGGFGALKIAMRFPNLFNSASAHSPFLLFKPLYEFSEGEINRWLRKPFQLVFGNPIDQEYWRDHDPIELVDSGRGNIHSLPFYFDCGTEDRFGFHTGAKRLDRVMTKAGIRHTFNLFPGGRSHWDQVRGHVAQSLQFHSEQFYAKRTISQF